MPVKNQESKPLNLDRFAMQGIDLKTWLDHDMTLVALIDGRDKMGVYTGYWIRRRRLPLAVQVALYGRANPAG